MTVPAVPGTAGCPVVISNAGSLEEIAREAALTVAPDDVDGLRAAMRALVTDPKLRDELREHGFARAREFSWERTARETERVYDLVRSRCSTARRAWGGGEAAGRAGGGSEWPRLAGGKAGAR